MGPILARKSFATGSRASGAFLTLAQEAPVCTFVSRAHHGGRREPSRLELLGELRHDLPPARQDCTLNRPRKGAFDVRFLWPKRDRLPRTYVNSRRVISARVDVNRRDFNNLAWFEPPLLHPDPGKFGCAVGRATPKAEMDADIAVSSAGKVGKGSPNPSRRFSASRM